MSNINFGNFDSHGSLPRYLCAITTSAVMTNSAVAVVFSLFEIKTYWHDVFL